MSPKLRPVRSPDGKLVPTNSSGSSKPVIFRPAIVRTPSSWSSTIAPRRASVRMTPGESWLPDTATTGSPSVAMPLSSGASSLPPLTVKSPARTVGCPEEKRRTVGSVSTLLWMSEASTTRSVSGVGAPAGDWPARSSSSPAIERSEVSTRSEYFSALRRSACDWSRIRSSSSPEAK